MTAPWDVDGLALLLIFGIAGCVFLAVCALIEYRLERKRERWTLTRVDYARCERAGSQASFARRLRAGGAS